MSIQTAGYIIGPGEVTISTKWAQTQTADQLLAAMTEFIELSKSEFLAETHCSGTQSFKSINDFRLAEWLAKCAVAEKARRQQLLRKRRAEFQSVRPHI